MDTEYKNSDGFGATNKKSVKYMDQNETYIDQVLDCVNL